MELSQQTLFMKIFLDEMVTKVNKPGFHLKDLSLPTVSNDSCEGSISIDECKKIIFFFSFNLPGNYELPME